MESILDGLLLEKIRIPHEPIKKDIKRELFYNY